MSTPHIKAEKGDFAKTVLMPGDPLRSKMIAEKFLENAVLVNNVRGVQGYTGTWKGVPVSVMASGMGMPAIGIYSYELFNFFDVDNIIRVGSCGAYPDDIKLMDLIAAQAACTDSDYAHQYELGGTFAPIADFTLLTEAVAAAKEKGIDMKVGNIFSSDNFYAPEGCDSHDKWRRMGVLGTEMESAALYMNAAYAGKRGLCICTVTDHLYRDEALSPEDRQLSLTQMIEVALDTAVRMSKY